MRDLSDWLTLKSLTDLARFADSSPQELGRIVVTDRMTEAAMDYVQSLYDPLMSTYSRARRPAKKSFPDECRPESKLHLILDKH